VVLGGLAALASAAVLVGCLSSNQRAASPSTDAPTTTTSDSALAGLSDEGEVNLAEGDGVAEAVVAPVAPAPRSDVVEPVAPEEPPAVPPAVDEESDEPAPADPVPDDPCAALPPDGSSLLVGPDSIALPAGVYHGSLTVLNCSDGDVNWTGHTKPSVGLDDGGAVALPGETTTIDFHVDPNQWDAGVIGFKIKISEPGHGHYIDVQAAKPDVTQDVFVVAAERLQQLRDPDRLRPWLFAVLRNEVFRRAKRRQRMRPTDLAAVGGAEMVAPHDPSADGAIVEQQQLGELVRVAAAGLGQRDQLLLELSVRQGLAGADLADAVGVSQQQCHVLMHRMRERVQRSMGAITVARMGRMDRDDLQALLRGWDGVLTETMRKRIAGHIDDCATCEENSRRHGPLAMMSAAPAFALPADLRDRVLSNVHWPSGPAGSSGSSPANDPSAAS
jgi:RNA polymerase sigma factor (sigma-70 family)